MADRRMFAKTIIDSDAFLDMPVTARLLYYDLAMRADDDGFVNSPKKIMRIVGASQDDLKILIGKKFVIPFENGVVVIKHWRIHNYIRKDRYSGTKYKEQLAQLELDENNAYRFVGNGMSSDCHLPDNTDTQDRLGKDSIGKDSIEEEDEDITEPEEIVEEEPQPKEPPVFQIELNDGTLYDVTQSEIDYYQKLYPAVNVPNEMRAIVGWNHSNPKKRKTRSGIKRHINTWLSDKQNKGGSLRQTNNGYVPIPASIPEVDDGSNPFAR
ncbi:MAG: replisome organizer [Ruminococcus sp.]|nr:replisome organizer [Ruminococcus sp.]